MFIFRSIRIFLICAVTVIYFALSAHASVIFFSGQLDYIELDTGGVYSGTAIDTDVVGSIDDDDANGFISDGDTYTSFGCCIAAGGLSVTNDMALTAKDAAFLNEVAGSVQYSEGDVVDSINIEGDKNTSSGGRIEIGITYVLSSDSFENEDLSNYPVEQSEIELALFFIYEEDDLGTDIYSAGGKIKASSFSSDFNYNHLLNGEYYGVDYFPDGYTDFIDLLIDGDGGITFNEIEVSDGTPLISGSLGYNVESDGEINASLDNRGIVSFDGRVGFMADFDAIGGFNIFAKKSSGLSNSILNGEYYAINYFSDDYTDFIEVIFDGVGGFSYQTLKTSDGSPLDSGTGTYTIASDGQITIGDNKGVVTSDGQFVFTVDLAGIPGLVILINKSSGLTASILDGDYYSITSDSNNFVSFNEVNFNGNGTLTLQQIQKNNGKLLESFSTTYTVSSNGQIRVKDYGVRGVVSSDGRYIFLVGFGDNQDPPPGIDIFVKKFFSKGEGIVTLLTPSGGETIPYGSTYPIEWVASSSVESFKLQYSINNGKDWVTIAKDITGTNYDWIVPTFKKNKKNCLVKVVGYDASGEKVDVDKSNAPFTIEVMNIISPNGGEVLASGGTYDVTWDTNDTKSAVDYVEIYCSKNEGDTWKLMATEMGNPGVSSCVFPVVKKNEDDCLVKVMVFDAENNKVAWDKSDAFFEIEVVTITSPNGGETLKSGTTHSIAWDTYETKREIAKVVLQYTKNGGRTWEKITAIKGENPGTFLWTVPDVSKVKEQSKVKVQLKDINGNELGVGSSDSDFRIEP